MQRILTRRADALPRLAEVFREHGFEGSTLSMLSKATGLGKGSLYNFFPGGKEEMMAAVLADIDQWFAKVIFLPLESSDDPSTAIILMMRDVTSYFRSGSKVCLIGWVGLGSSRDAFSHQTDGYFARWISSLARCLEHGHVPKTLAFQLAEETVSGIQGAIILSRALGEEATFSRIVGRCEGRLLGAIDRCST